MDKSSRECSYIKVYPLFLTVINFELIKIRQELDSDKINKKTNNAFRKLFPQRKEELIKKKNQNENRLKEIEQKSKNLNLIVNSFLWFNNN